MELIGAVTGLSTVSLLVLLHVCICAERSPPPPTPTLPGPCTNTGYLPDRQRWAVTFDNGIKAACVSGQLARSDKPPPEGGSAAGGGCCQERWQDKAKDAAAACDHHHHHHAEPCAEGGADALCSSSHGSVETAVLAALRAGSGGGTGGGEDRPRLELPAADLALVELVARHGAVRGFPPSDSSAETCCMTSELCGNSMQGDWDAKAVALSARGVISQDPEPPAEPDGWPLKDAGARLAGRWAALIPVLQVPPRPGERSCLRHCVIGPSAITYMPPFLCFAEAASMHGLTKRPGCSCLRCDWQLSRRCRACILAAAVRRGRAVIYTPSLTSKTCTVPPPSTCLPLCSSPPPQPPFSLPPHPPRLGAAD